MKLTVGGKEYLLEYTFEAAHNKKCVDACWNYFSGAYMVRGTALDELQGSEVANKMATVDKMIDSMSDIPEMVITLLYAGLLENHGPDSSDPVIIGDRDARNLYKQFCKENPEDSRVSDFEMLDAIKAQMEKDGFFKRIGLEKFLQQMTQTEEVETQKIPQDHKKKTSHSGN